MMADALKFAEAEPKILSDMYGFWARENKHLQLLSTSELEDII